MSERPALPAVETLVPHEPPMRLLDTVLAWDGASVRCGATPGPAFVFARADGTFDAIVLLELMAQAAAVHAGLQAGGARPRVGWLVSCRELVLEHPGPLRVGQPLELEVVHHAGDDTQPMRGYHGAAFAADGTRLARATFAVYLTPQQEAP